jgi:uncharacterized membrane protein (DUF485 family)
MLHGPTIKWKKDHTSPIKELLGKWLFVLYTIVYAGFILVNVLSPEFMGIDVGSFNVAIAYGFGLIIFAILLALIYNHISTRVEEWLKVDETGKEEVKE